MRPTGRENTGKWSAIITAAVMTALLLFLLIFFYLRYEKARTLHAALQDLQDPPVYFSRESGFFEKGFVLKLGRNPDLPENVEIRYTLNGDDPTADSLLYKDGIDLTEAVREMKTLAKEKEEKKSRGHPTGGRRSRSRPPGRGGRCSRCDRTSCRSRVGRDRADHNIGNDIWGRPGNGSSPGCGYSG